jgi:hypothetical protein
VVQKKNEKKEKKKKRAEYSSAYKWWTVPFILFQLSFSALEKKFRHCGFRGPWGCKTRTISRLLVKNNWEWQIGTFCYFQSFQFVMLPRLYIYIIFQLREKINVQWHLFCLNTLVCGKINFLIFYGWPTCPT